MPPVVTILSPTFKPLWNSCTFFRCFFIGSRIMKYKMAKTITKGTKLTQAGCWPGLPIASTSR